ncbi:hypothetical protein CCHR01_14076 [Colletotrichum chrysophilum]|uniref:Uncharacterized protein n=1 Tax=Colletotrichum chrysophilum TaxID=1836956 RepID=A0AAD9A8A2_9PEZI|nr:hypothetical protein CCHR01_14076 [Colletotrichum chrysophilum]
MSFGVTIRQSPSASDAPRRRLSHLPLDLDSGTDGGWRHGFMRALCVPQKIPPSGASGTVCFDDRDISNKRENRTDVPHPISVLFA